MTMKMLAESVIDDRDMTTRAKQIYLTKWNKGDGVTCPFHVLASAPDRYRVGMNNVPDRYIWNMCKMLGCTVEFLTGKST